MAKSDRELQTSCQADQSLADEWSWHGNLYYFGAPGASSQKWYGHGHDNEYPYLYARFTTTQEWARKTGGICVQRHNSLRLIEFWVQSTCTARVHSQLLNHVPRVLHFQRFQTDMSTFSNDSNVCFFSFRFVLFISFHHFSSISLIASIWLETARTWCPWKQSRMSRYLWDGLGQSVVEATLVLQALASMWTSIQMAPGPSCGECGFWTMTVRQAMPKKWEKSIRPVPDVVNSNWSKFGFFGTSLSVIIGHHTLSSCFFWVAALQQGYDARRREGHICEAELWNHHNHNGHNDEPSGKLQGILQCSRRNMALMGQWTILWWYFKVLVLVIDVWWRS